MAAEKDTRGGLGPVSDPLLENADRLPLAPRAVRQTPRADAAATVG